MFSSLCVLAAEEQTGNETVAESEVASESLTDSAMIREAGSIMGFQPLIVAGQEIDATFIDETLGEKRGAVILLHDIGEGIDNQNSLSTVRTSLPAAGWATMTLALDYPFESTIYLSDALESESSDQLEAESSNLEQSTSSEDNASPEPAIDQNDSQQEVESLPPISNVQRIEAALAFLNEKQVERIILVGYGKGGESAVEHLSKISTPIQGLILISTSEIANKAFFDELSFPIVDIYGERDSLDVLAAITQRRVWMKQQQKLNINYFQREIVGADTLFYGFEQNLFVTVRSWLNSQFVEPKDN